jgi:energy-coupling factor transport system ATP-binding protein
LKGVELQVRAGEIVVLMGRNGSGKSTLLRCTAGLLRAKKGEIVVKGRTTAGREVADICRDLAYLPQNPDDLLFAETVEQELRATLRNHEMDHNGGTTAWLAGLISELGLLDQVQSYPRDLSVGQRQRVALGAVMITEPELLLLDEPTRGLDAAAKQSLAALWKRWRDAGKGILLVTHDVELAAQVADRVVFMSDGEIIAGGPAGEVMGASPLFSPQMARLFPGRGWLTVADALAGLDYHG